MASPLPLLPGMPMLASGADLLGIVIILVVAGLAQLVKWVGGQTSNNNQAPPLSRRDTGPTSQAKRERRDDLAEEMKRFLQEAQRQRGAPPPLPTRSTSPQPRRQQPPPLYTKKRAFQPSQPKRAVAMVHESTTEESHAETMREIRSHQTPQMDLTTSAPMFRFSRAMLRSPDNLKQAIVLTEILGKPRSLTM